MSKIGDFFIRLFETALETEGETLLDAELQTIHDKNVPEYTAALYGLNAGAIALGKIPSIKPGGIADIIIKALQDSVLQSAKANGITLPTTTAVASLAAVPK
jgi:hypothetical protein